MKFIKRSLLILVLIFCTNLSAQNTVINSEVGIFLGPAYIQTDYGEAKNFTSSSSNVGMDFGIAYIADFSDSRYSSKLFSWISDHMKTRIELSFSKVNLEHDEARIENGSETSRNQFKGTTGEVKLINIGAFGEWYFKSILQSTSKFQPYLLTGMSYTSAKSSLSVSSFGLPNIYTVPDRLFIGTNNALSFTYGLGARYKLDDIDLVAEGRFQSFMSDKIEGIDTDISGDKNNDTQVLFKIGVIFHLD